ncbi:phosphoesterase [Pseudomonas phage UNO-G1W1]|jgi:calcineurin-like phosphoesterase family protein|uniref:Phosphoesterase n=1 Tax=Pseudomonas phage UNO-G1W1 TaxID=3136609 RepID=A0AAX4MVN6_9CAUD
MSEQKIWWSSDLHFEHKKIVQYTNRPWTQEQNTEKLIERWNDRVGLMDDVYHLGDFAFMWPKQINKLVSIINELNGKIHFIKGNHCDDRLWRMIEDRNIPHVVWVKDYHELTIEGQHIVMCHYPMAQWNRAHHGTFMLHGHCHGSYQGPGKILDVGIDNHPDHQMWSYEEICAYMKDRQYKGVSHHEEGGR